MALGSTQTLTEISTRNLPGVKGRPAHQADNLTAICEPIVWKMWEPRRLTTLWASTARYRDSFFFTHGWADNIRMNLRICGFIWFRTGCSGARFWTRQRMIWKFHSGGYEEYYLLGYNAVYSVESLRTFRRNMSPPSYSSILKMEICSSETSANFQRNTLRYISEDSYRCANFGSYITFFVTFWNPWEIWWNKILRLYISLAEKIGVFGRRSPGMSAGTSATLTQAFNCFRQSVQENSGDSPGIRSRQLPSRLFPIQYIQYILKTDNVVK
jgi:hypothetical protein